MTNSKRARGLALTALAALGALVTTGCDIDGFWCDLEGKIRIGRRVVRWRTDEGVRKFRHTARFRPRSELAEATIGYKALFFPSFEFSLSVDYTKFGKEEAPNRFASFGVGRGDGGRFQLLAQPGTTLWQVSAATEAGIVPDSTSQHAFAGDRVALDLRFLSESNGGGGYDLTSYARLHGDPIWNLVAAFPNRPSTERYEPAFSVARTAKGDDLQFSHFLPWAGNGFPFEQPEALAYHVACAQTTIERAKCYADECPPGYVGLILGAVVTAESETEALLSELGRRLALRAEKKKKTPEQVIEKEGAKLLKLYPKVFNFVDKKKTPSGKAIWNKLNGLEKRIVKIVEAVEDFEDEN